MMYPRLRAPAVLVALAFGGLVGCSGLNPGLISAVGGTPASSIAAPNGTTLVVFANLTNTPARATLTVTKVTGGTMTIGLTALAFNTTNDLDFAIAAQECDVQSIQLLNVIYADATGPIIVPSTEPPLVAGVSLNCGSVITITFRGTPPNVFADMAVF